MLGHLVYVSSQRLRQLPNDVATTVEALGLFVSRLRSGAMAGVEHDGSLEGVATSDHDDETSRDRNSEPRLTFKKQQELLWADSLAVSLRLASEYRPLPFSGSVGAFQAELIGQNATAWKGLARDGVVVYELPGSHLDMLEEPGVIETAALIAKALERIS